MGGRRKRHYAYAFEYLVSGTNFPNVKFLIDRRRDRLYWERGRSKDMLCDVMLVSDTTMISEDVPSINTGMRGLAYLEVKVTGPDKDLHSGHYGGAIANPINVLCSMIARLIDEKGRITVKGFYDDVVELSAEDRALLGRAPFDPEHFKKSIGVSDLAGEEGYSTWKGPGSGPAERKRDMGRLYRRRCQDRTAFYAKAKISMRLVPNQDHKEYPACSPHIFTSLAPSGVKVEVQEHHGGQGFWPHIVASYQAARGCRTGIRVDPVPSGEEAAFPYLPSWKASSMRPRCLWVSDWNVIPYIPPMKVTC